MDVTEKLITRLAALACGALMMGAVNAVAPVLLSFPAMAQDADNGKRVWRRCRACHDIGPRARNKVGPILTGIVGRKAGSVEGYNYSRANRAAGKKGLVWTEDVLLEYLKKPRSFMPGTKMAFAGLRNEDDRRDLIAYIKQASEPAGK